MDAYLRVDAAYAYWRKVRRTLWVVLVLGKTLNYAYWRIGDEQSIIAWVLYRGSIPLYDYSLGVRVHPPLYIVVLQSGMLCFATNNVVELVYNGSTCRWNKAIASPVLLRVENTTNRKANAI